MNAKELFQALEFAHYADRFRNKVFVIALPRETPFQELLLDIKVLAGYHIQVVLVVPDPDLELERLISISNHRGTRFHLSLVTEATYNPASGQLGLDLERIRKVLEQGKTPIIGYHAGLSTPSLLETTFPLAGEVAGRLKADKLFLVGADVAQLEEALGRTHVTIDDLESIRASLPEWGLPSFAHLLEFVQGLLERGLPDVILMEGKPAHLFREVFTLDGAGILFNSGRGNLIRQAQVRDTTDIALLLRPEIEAERILPVDEADIESNISRYWIYEADGLLVGSARLKIYGSWAEIAQFSTLPRYRGKGRAKELAQRMILEAREIDKEAVFALSIDPRMWEFFLSIGFKETERSDLPADWQTRYDFSRTSHAFIMELE